MQEKNEKNDYLVLETKANVSATLRNFKPGDSVFYAFNTTHTSTPTWRSRYNALKKMGHIQYEIKFFERNKDNENGTYIICI